MLAVEANWEDGFDDRDDHTEWALQVDTVFRQRGATGAYVGFYGIEETDERIEERCFSENCSRLRELKSTYDSGGVFATALLADRS